MNSQSLTDYCTLPAARNRAIVPGAISSTIPLSTLPLERTTERYDYLAAPRPTQVDPHCAYTSTLPVREPLSMSRSVGTGDILRGSTDTSASRERLVARPAVNETISDSEHTDSLDVFSSSCERTARLASRLRQLPVSIRVIIGTPLLPADSRASVTYTES